MIRALLLLVGTALVFAVGLSVGKAINDSPAPAGTQTLFRTLDPLPLAPAALETVTVTVPGP